MVPELAGAAITMTSYRVNGLSQSASTSHPTMEAKHEMTEFAGDSQSYHLCVCELNLPEEPTLDTRATEPWGCKL